MLWPDLCVNLTFVLRTKDLWLGTTELLKNTPQLRLHLSLGNETCSWPLCLAIVSESMQSAKNKFSGGEIWLFFEIVSTANKKDYDAELIRDLRPFKYHFQYHFPGKTVRIIMKSLHPRHVNKNLKQPQNHLQQQQKYNHNVGADKPNASVIHSPVVLSVMGRGSHGSVKEEACYSAGSPWVT